MNFFSAIGMIADIKNIKQNIRENIVQCWFYEISITFFFSSQLFTMLKASAAVQWLSHASQSCVFSSYYGKILSYYIYHKWFDRSEKEYDWSSSAWRQMFCYKTHKYMKPLDFGNLSWCHRMYIFKFYIVGT